MKLLFNDYDKLKQDNIDESVKLQPDNRRMIDRITNYISSKKVSLFELEVIKKDLIGIAAEAETEELSVEEKLGVSEKEFAKNLSFETNGKSFFEQCMLFGRYIFFIAWGLYLMTFGFSGFPKEYGITLELVFFIFILCFYDEVLVNRISKRFLYSEKQNGKKILLGAGSFIILAIWATIPPDGMFLIRGNGWIIGSGLLIIAIAINIVNNLYWNDQSKKYNWK